MPQHHLVGQFPSISFYFLLSFHYENSNQLNLILVMGSSVSVLDVFLDPLYVLGVVEGGYAAFKFEVFDVYVALLRVVGFLSH
jgi:hypothetical protein